MAWTEHSPLWAWCLPQDASGICDNSRRAGGWAAAGAMLSPTPALSAPSRTPTGGTGGGSGRPGWGLAGEAPDRAAPHRLLGPKPALAQQAAAAPAPSGDHDDGWSWWSQPATPACTPRPHVTNPREECHYFPHLIKGQANACDWDSVFVPGQNLHSHVPLPALPQCQVGGDGPGLGPPRVCFTSGSKRALR